MKLLRKILLFILIVIIIIGGVLYLNGRKLYNEKLAAISLDEKIKSIKSSDSFIALSELPVQYKNAVIAVEDHRYYKHGAIDPIALVRAIVSNINTKTGFLLFFIFHHFLNFLFKL